jgi:hypothetical protein
MAFPTTGILDDFNRADEGPPPSASWSANGLEAASTLSVVSNVAKDSSSNGGFWGASVGPDSEAYVTLSTLQADGQLLYVFIRAAQIGSVGTADGYAFRFTREDSNPGFNARWYRLDNGTLTLLGLSYNDTAGAISAGIKIGADAVGSDLTIYVNKSGTWVSTVARSDSTYSSAGLIGMSLVSSTPSADDFGGGTISSAPTVMLAMGMLGTGRV